MTPSEYQELTTFFVDQLGRHQRETAVIVESLRAIEANRRAIEDNSRRIDANGTRIDANGARIDALTLRVGRLETAVSTRFDDHEEQLRAVERERTPGGMEVAFRGSQPGRRAVPKSTAKRRVAIRSMVGALCAVLAAGCAGTTRIGTILDDPTEYDGRRVRIEGEVTQTVGLPVVGGTYTVDDGTGTMRVVTDQGGGVPREGADVSVVGVFRALFQIGAESLSVLQERDRDVR